MATHGGMRRNAGRLRVQFRLSVFGARLLRQVAQARNPTIDLADEQSLVDVIETLIGREYDRIQQNPLPWAEPWDWEPL